MQWFPSWSGIDVHMWLLDLRVMNHFGFILPKSVRTWFRRACFGSKTTGPSAPRQKRDHFLVCHLMAKKASEGKLAQAVNGVVGEDVETPKCVRGVRTYVVSDQS